MMDLSPWWPPRNLPHNWFSRDFLEEILEASNSRYWWRGSAFNYRGHDFLGGSSAFSRGKMLLTWEVFGSQLFLFSISAIFGKNRSQLCDFIESGSQLCGGYGELYVESRQLVIVRGRIFFPPASKQMDILHGLLPESDLVSLHCAVTNETLQILNFETLQHRKARASIMSNGGSDPAETNVASQRSSG